MRRIFCTASLDGDVPLYEFERIIAYSTIQYNTDFMSHRKRKTAIQSMYWTDLGLWKIVDIIKDTRSAMGPSQISDAPFYVIVLL